MCDHNVCVIMMCVCVCTVLPFPEEVVAMGKGLDVYFNWTKVDNASSYTVFYCIWNLKCKVELPDCYINVDYDVLSYCVCSNNKSIIL